MDAMDAIAVAQLPVTGAVTSRRLRTNHKFDASKKKKKTQKSPSPDAGPSRFVTSCHPLPGQLPTYRLPFPRNKMFRNI